ncbi:MAG: hypothetical protein FWF16_06340, partial [Microbacteriaceae bacterium]|nr:hypothetical protein [Microbacteriaceae bacterium]
MTQLSVHRHTSALVCGRQLRELNLPSDVVAVTDRAFAQVAPKWWPGNPGAVLVMPRAHVENVYALSPE